MSHYLLCAAGGFGLALPPEPGLTLANTLWLQNGAVDTAVLQGRVDIDLDLTTLLDLAVASYAFETPILGGTYSGAAVIPFGYANLRAEAPIRLVAASAPLATPSTSAISW